MPALCDWSSGQAQCPTYVVLAGDRIVACERMHQKSVGGAGLEPDAERAIVARVTGTRHERSVAANDFAAERVSEPARVERCCYVAHLRASPTPRYFWEVDRMSGPILP